MPDATRRTEHLGSALLLAGGVLIAGLCVVILRPFLEPVVWATVLALVLHPLYQPVARVVRSGSLAALLLCLLGAALLGIPFYWVATALPEQIREAYTRVQAAAGGEAGDQPFYRVWQWAEATAGRFGYDLRTGLNGLLRQGGARLLAAAPGLIGGVFSAAFHFAIATMTLFFFLRDGEGLARWLRDLIPLDHGQTQELFGKIRNIVRATVLGGLAIAAAQGALGGVLFWIGGLPTPVLWAVIMGLLSLMPLIGAWLVWAPAGLTLLWQGHIWQGAVVLGGGLFGVSMIDNLLRPLIIGQHAQMPTLLILFSILGGVQAFGAVGLIVGPVLVALLAGILEFTRIRLQSQRATPLGEQPGPSGARP